MKYLFRLNKVTLSNFRNHLNLNMCDFSNINIFIGNNACGKTNFLESIYLTVQGKSFKKSKISEFCNYDIKNKNVKINIKLIKEYVSNVNKFASAHELTLCIDDNQKKHYLDDKLKKIGDIKNNFPCVVFTPDDLYLIKNGNRERRNAFDNLGCQLSKEYNLVFKNYNKILFQKNSLLKEKNSGKLLWAVNEIFITHATQLSYFRINLIKKIEKKVNMFYKKIVNDHNEQIEIEYQPAFLDKYKLDKDIRRSSIKKLLEDSVYNCKNVEDKYCTSLYGPHRDKIIFKINHKDASKFASQGQQRSIVLAFKLSELNILSEQLNINPILLLDDVMSELDQKRRNYLLKLLINNIQTFITTTNLSYFSQELLDGMSTKIYKM